MRISCCQRRRAAAVLAAATVLVAGCGTHAKSATGASRSPSASAASTAPAGTAATAPVSQTANSCSVVTAAEAGAALGQAVRPPVRGHATVEGGVACVFYGPDVPAGANPDDPVPDSVRVVLVTGARAFRFFSDYRSKVHAQAEAGLGDNAYYDGYASLSVLKGAAYLRIAVIGVPDILRAEKKLAADALPRM